MGTTFYFVEAPSVESEVLRWFRNLAQPPAEFTVDRGQRLYFQHLGPIAAKADDSPDPARSPVVSFYPPRAVRDVFWTVGEVHFLAKYRQIAELDTIRRSFKRWIRNFEVVFEQFPKPEKPFNYYLEGGIQNIAPIIYALPSGRAALDKQQYFISEGASHRDLTALRQKLRLRGVVCE